MKRLTFLTLHRPDRSPSQRFRFEQYIDFLRDDGFSINHFYLLDAQDDKYFYGTRILPKIWILVKSIFKLFSHFLAAKKDTIFFVQRECFMLGTAFFEKLFKTKGKLVFDFDDSIWIHDISETNKKLAFLKNPNKTADIIKASDAVIAGNLYLAEYAKQFNNNVVIIPTTLDTEKHKKVNTSTSQTVCIGWTGSHTTIKHFKLAIPFLIKLKEKYGDKISFRIIGDANYYCHELNTQALAWNEATEVADLSAIYIGIMPLPDDKWSKGKCGFKGLQYMSLEIPSIMSPVGVNTEIIEDGINGFLADSEQEWIDKISLLIESKELREKLGKAGRETVVARYSVAANKQKYLDLLSSL